MKHKLKGTGVALVTPFKKDKSIDFQSLGNLLEHTSRNGVDYFVVLGTTAEAATLKKEEKRAIIDFTIKFSAGKYPIIAGFGGNNTRELTENIKNYDFNGIDAILSVAPAYNKPSQLGIYEHYKTLSAVSPVPVILYNVPGRTSCNITAETTLKLANECSNIVAIKEASGDFEQIMTIVKHKPKDFTVLSGDDMLTLPLISVGVEGVISVVANVLPKQFSELVNFALNSDFKNALNVQHKLLEIMNTLFVEGNPAGAKAALKILNIMENQLRLPLTPVSSANYDKLKKQIETILKQA